MHQIVEAHRAVWHRALPLATARTLAVGTGPEVAVVIPTFNERGNVAPLIERLDAAFADWTWEAIFVDDNSPDGTADAARAIAARDHRVRVIQRIGRRGLSSACIEGMCATAAPLVAVIDGDMQHDERLLSRMAERLMMRSDIDLVVGSRFVDGGGTGAWQQDRVAKSEFATQLARRVLNTDLADPMSGFFMIRSELVRKLVPNLSGIGFKILLDLTTASARPLRFEEMPYVFRTRTEGESKLDHVVALEYLIALYDRRFGKMLSARAALFLGIAGWGAAVQLLVLATLMLGAGLAFVPSMLAATFAALIFGFCIDNALTYREKRLRGLGKLAKGFGRFALACLPGAAAGVGFAAYLEAGHHASWAVAAMAGVAVMTGWSYLRSARFAWGRY